MELDVRQITNREASSIVASSCVHGENSTCVQSTNWQNIMQLIKMFLSHANDLLKDSIQRRGRERAQNEKIGQKHKEKDHQV